MKFGPITIERNRPVDIAPRAKTSASPDYRELGAPGTAIFGGWMQQQDYSVAWSVPGRYDIIDQMRFGDGQVAAVMNLVKKPIERAFWQVEPASDSAEDKAIAEFIEKDLEEMSVSFIDFLRQALLMLDYGSMLFEKCWFIGSDGMVHLRKLAPRAPRSVLKWMVDENGGFNGIEQQAIKASGFSVESIPADKLLLFVNDQEGSDFRGRSMLRAAYKHWYIKDGLYKVDAIAKEKRSVGVDVGTIKPGAADKGELKTALERSMMTLHSHEKQFFIEDEENFTYRLETGSARIADALQSIEHHNLQILRSINVEFAGMGAGSTGSLAMHKDKSTLFLMILEAIADKVAGVMSTYLIKPWVDYNWLVSAYPKFKYSRLDTRDATALAEAVSKLVSAGALTNTPETEAELRVVLDLPELTEADIPLPTPPIPADQGAVDAVRRVQERQIARLMAEAPSLFRADNPKAPEAVDVPYRQAMATCIADALGCEPRRAKAIADYMAGSMKAAFMLEMDAQLGAGAYDEAALAQRLDAPWSGFADLMAAA